MNANELQLKACKRHSPAAGATQCRVRLDIQTKSTKRTVYQSDSVLLLEQAIEMKEKNFPSHFLKFHLASHANGTLEYILN